MNASRQSTQELAIALAATAYGKQRISVEQFRRVVCHATDLATCEQWLKSEADLSDEDLKELRDCVNNSSRKSTFEIVQSHTVSTIQSEDLSLLPDFSTRTLAPHETTVRYEPICRHAQGGLGQVWIAEDQEVKRRVALKEIREDLVNDVANSIRFLQEGQITGQLEHPGIVPVYGLGRHADGRPFYAMRLIQGKSFKEAVDEARSQDELATRHYTSGVDFQRLLRSFLAACQAIEYAHSRQVIHRDIKPENIMLGEFGETLVVDWGLAKVLDEPDDSTVAPTSAAGSVPNLDLAKTVQGSILGTPAYMSPEQATSRLDQIGKQSDIYGLGATLFYLLVGKPPVERPSDEDLQQVEKERGIRLRGSERRRETVKLILRKVAEGDFQRPSELDIRVPNRLEEICLKAMSIKPEERYGNVGEMVDEIEKFFTDQPLQHWQSAITRFTELVETFPEESEFLAALARAKVNAGGVLSSMRRFDDALVYFREALPHFEELLGRQPDKTEYIREIAVAHNSLSRALIRMNNTVEAVTEYKSALDALDRYLASRGCDPEPGIAVLLLEPDQCGFVRLGVADQDEEVD